MRVRIDTEDAALGTAYPFEQVADGVRTYETPLDTEGGMRGELIEITTATAHAFSGNYVLVLEGNCDIDGASRGEDMLVVAQTVTPEPFEVAASEGATCLALGVSF